MVDTSPHQPVYRRPLFEEPKRTPGLLYAFLHLPHGPHMDEAMASLASLASQSHPALEIVLLYSGTDDGTLHREARRAAPRCRFLSLHAPISAAQAYNMGFLYAVEEGADSIFCLRPPFRAPAPDALAALAKAMAQDSRTGIAVPPLTDGEKIMTGMSAMPPFSGGEEAFFTHAFLVRRDVLDAGFRLREDFAGALEGMDFTLRLRAEGWKIRFVQEPAFSSPRPLASLLFPENFSGLYLFARNHARMFIERRRFNAVRRWRMKRRCMAWGKKLALPERELRDALHDAFADALEGRMGLSPKWNAT
jgi:GT2 family glycosyltransferase